MKVASPRGMVFFGLKSVVGLGLGIGEIVPLIPPIDISTIDSSKGRPLNSKIDAFCGNSWEG